MRPNACSTSTISATLSCRSVDNLHARVDELLHRSLAVARLDLDRASPFAVDDHLEPGSPGVERRLLDAVVEREPHNVDLVDAVVAQKLLELGALEAGVALELGGVAGINDCVDLAAVDVGMELGTLAPLHAVNRPDAAVDLEGRVVGGMPIPRGDHKRSLRREAVHRPDHGIAVLDGERAAGGEVVLHVDDDQSLHPRQYSQAMATPTQTIGDRIRPSLLTVEDAVTIDVSGRTDAAVLVPLYESRGQLHAVFTKRRDDLRRHPGEISFPGGRRDEDDRDLLATSLREAEEEIGLPVDAVDVLGALQPTPTIATGYAVYPFVGMIDPGWSGLRVRARLPR